MIAKEKEAMKKAKQAVVVSQRRQPSPYQQQQHFNQQLKTLTEAIEGSHSPPSRGAQGGAQYSHRGRGRGGGGGGGRGYYANERPYSGQQGNMWAILKLCLLDYDDLQRNFFSLVFLFMHTVSYSGRGGGGVGGVANRGKRGGRPQQQHHHQQRGGAHYTHQEQPRSNFWLFFYSDEIEIYRDTSLECPH